MQSFRHSHIQTCNKRTDSIVDLLKGSVDLLKGSVDLLKGSVDLLKGSVDLLKGSVDLLKGIDKHTLQSVTEVFLRISAYER